MWLDVPLFSKPAKIFSKNVVAVVKLRSSGVVVFCGFVACLKLNPDDQVEMNTASMKGVEKKIRVVFFIIPFEVGQSMAMLTSLVADSFIKYVIPGANWM